MDRLSWRWRLWPDPSLALAHPWRATFIGQRLQARWTRFGAELEEREKLYGIFVEEAIHLFVDAIQRSGIDPAEDYAALFKGGTYPADVE